jgi:hypothetical protein
VITVSVIGPSNSGKTPCTRARLYALILAMTTTNTPMICANKASIGEKSDRFAAELWEICALAMLALWYFRMS